MAIEGIARDITDRKEAEARQRELETELFQAQKLESIGTLAGGIAHDFNNILTGILGYCELAILESGDRKDALENLREIRAGGLRAKELVRQILTFSRRSVTTLVPLELSVVVGEALKFFRSTSPATVEIRHDLGPGRVLADATQIHQIVLNLCTNSIHAMKDGHGCLTVTTGPVRVDPGLSRVLRKVSPGDYVRLTIEDTGCGMDEETLERIFDPFFTTKKHGEGTGLGLAVVQGIIINHEAQIRVTSKVGEGTRFEIYFKASNRADVAPISKAQIPHGDQREVLLVDDEEPVARFAASSLRLYGYRVKVFGRPEEALAEHRRSPGRFSAIVTDMTMPNMTGIDLIRRIRETRANMSAVIISGYNRSLAESQPEAGIVLLGKPFSGADLAQALGEAIRLTPQPSGLA